MKDNGLANNNIGEDCISYRRYVKIAAISWTDF